MGAGSGGGSNMLGILNENNTKLKRDEDFKPKKLPWEAHVYEYFLGQHTFISY